MLDSFFNETLWIFEHLLFNGWIIKMVWGFLTLSSLALFLYHLQAYYELDFFIENVDALGEFSMASYKTFMIIFSLVPLLAALNIIYSVLEGLNSRKFLERFGCS